MRLSAGSVVSWFYWITERPKSMFNHMLISYLGEGRKGSTPL